MTRSSTTQSILRNSIDYRALLTTKRLTLVVKFRLDVCFELLECVFIPTEKFTVHGVVCDIQRERFDIGDIDEWTILVLELTRQETALLKSFAL